MPGRTEASGISYKEVDSVSESSESSSEDEEDQELKARLEASGAPLIKRKRTKKRKKSSDKSRKRRRQKSSLALGSKLTNLEDAEEDDARWSEDEKPREGAGEDDNDPGALQATNLLGKLPFELICEIFSYLDLGDLIQLARTSPTLNAMLLAPSAQSIWSRSRRNAGYVLFPGMSEIKLAVTMEGSLCQYCAAKGDFERMWMARLCKGCMKQRAGPLPTLNSRLSWSSHEQLLFCVERMRGAWNARSHDEYISPSWRPRTLLCTQRKRPTTRKRQCNQRPACLNLRNTHRTFSDMSQIANAYWQTGRRILRALQDRHAWTLQEVAELEVHLFRDEHDSAFTRGVPDVPPPLPDHAPLAWEHFKTDLLAESEKIWYRRDAHRKKTARLRAECVRNSYEACGPALALALCMPVDVLPTWDRLKESLEVEALCRMPLTFLQAKPSAEYQQIFERAVEADRLIAIRYALAAHLDVSVEELSCDPDDYPATTYDEFFLDRVINRFEVGESEYLTYYEALATGHSAMALTKMTRASRRRAIAHVLRAAAVKDTECSLDRVDALGAGFLWKNAPPRYKGRAYTWRRMVDLLLRGGPKGLHLANLQNVHLVYERPEAAVELDKNPSLPAQNLAATEEKRATSSRSGRLVTNDMETDDTTENDSSLDASTSNSSRGTAAAAATATATAAPTLGLRRSSRLAPKL